MNVDEYLAKQPPAARRVLKQVRAVIKRALPRAEESITYAIPTFKIAGAAVIYFSGWKHHWALYPASALVRATLAKQLAHIDVEKGTLRFSYDERVPVGLVTRVAKLRAKEIAATLRTRAATKRAR